MPRRMCGRMRADAANVPVRRTRVVIAPIPAKVRPASARESTSSGLPRQALARPDTRKSAPGETTFGWTWTVADVERDAVVVAAAPPGRRFFTTETDAVPLMPPAVAVIVPVPRAVALNVVGLPGLGANVPSAGDTDQVGLTGTALPYRSLPVALNDWLVPMRG